MAEPDSQLGIGEIVASKYRVDQLIGEGGMGTVYAATHQVTGKRVALKWMLPQLSRDAEAVGRFLREAQAAGRIDHPNVVDVYDVGKHGDSMFIVMELLRGEPLASILDRGRVPWPDAVRMLLPAFRGVAAAHDHGVVHRDLKPDNIFITCDPDGTRREAKVLDFGISKLTTKAGENLRLTKTGSVMGTPYYMAPEQIQGTKEIDERTDIYALGVILYQALAGDLPFKAQTYHALIVEIATGTPTPLLHHAPDVPPDLVAIVARAMAREPDRRFQSVRDLMAALEGLENVSFSGMPRPESLAYREPSGGFRQSRASGPGSGSRPASQTLTPFTSDSPSVRTHRSGPVVWVGAGVAAVLVVAGLSALGLWAWSRSSAGTEVPGAGEHRSAAANPDDSLAPGPSLPPLATPRPAGTAGSTTLGSGAAAPPIAPAPQPPPAPTPAGLAPPSDLPALVDAPAPAEPTPAQPATRRRTERTTERGARLPISPHEPPPLVRRPPVLGPPPSAPATGPRRGRTGQLRPDEF